MALEALDPIRMDLSCYVKLSGSTLQVYGTASGVQNALLRIRKTFFHLCARQISPVRAYLLQWRNTDEIPTHVWLDEHSVANETSTKKSPRGEGILEDEKHIEAAQMASEYNVRWVRETIGNTLRNLHYLRAHLQLRMRLGIFFLQSYKPPGQGEAEDMYELNEYEDMTRESQFSGSTSEE